MAGNRVSKTVNGVQTWYVRDASGNVMSVYSKYFRIQKNGVAGKRVFTDLNGSISTNRRENGKTTGRKKPEYNQVTHFNLSNWYAEFLNRDYPIILIGMR